MKRNFKNILTACAVILAGTFLTNSCDKINPDTPEVPEPINWTMAVVNEGWFGNEGGSINIFDAENDSWKEKAYMEANPGKEFGTTTTVGVQNGDKIYFISKDAPHMIEADAHSLKNLSELELPEKGDQAMNFAATDAKKGVLTTSSGIYEVSLNPIALGKKIASGTCEDVLFTDGKVYYICDKTAYCYDPVSAAAPVKIGDAQIGFVKAGGYLWAADKDNLLKIDMEANTIEKVAVNCKISWNSWAYSPSQLCATKDGKNIFFTTSGSIKKYEIASGTVSELYTLKDKRVFYGSQLSIHPETDELYAITYEGEWSYLDTRIEIINSTTGENIKTLQYTQPKESNHYWFPSQVIFIR